MVDYARLLPSEDNLHNTLISGLTTRRPTARNDFTT